MPKKSKIFDQIKRRKIPYSDDVVFLCPHCENEYATYKGVKIHIVRFCFAAKKERLDKWVIGVLNGSL